MKKHIFAALAVLLSTAALAQTTSSATAASSPGVSAAQHTVDTAATQVRNDRQQMRAAQLAGNNAQTTAWSARLKSDSQVLLAAHQTLRVQRQQQALSDGSMHISVPLPASGN
ncbi:hypothetical protein G3A43_09005 [Paraburkholderia aspalathi]|nr:hypothetical protein [Paraburkholderia aspalathi]MBK3780397.1 hypothetical protein [Paraburkholderia aspalathi]